MVANGQIYIGLSARTNEEGAEQLARIARDACGYRAIMFEIPDSFLHLKGEVAYHGPTISGGPPLLTVSEEIAGHFAHSGCVLVETPPDERFGANCISSGTRILVHSGATRTKQVLQKIGFLVREIDLSEFAKIDGAMTCLWKLLPHK